MVGGSWAWRPQFIVLFYVVAKPLFGTVWTILARLKLNKSMEHCRWTPRDIREEAESNITLIRKLYCGDIYNMAQV